MTRLLEFYGRLHPLVLHLPIGLWIAVALLELFARPRKPGPSSAAPILVCCAAASAVFTAGSGWMLSRESGYEGPTFERHEFFGISIGVTSVLVLLFHAAARRGAAGDGRALAAYRACLAVVVLLLVPAGHFGSSLTRGSDWLLGPTHAPLARAPAAAPAESAPASAPAAPPAAAAQAPALAPGPSYADVAPLFASYCTQCHGETKHKGGLRLDTRAGALAGGEDGPVIAPGQPEHSEMMRRLRLGLDEEDHMPPRAKPQPRPEELATIEAWIRAGAPEAAQSAAVPAPGAAQSAAAPAHAEATEGAARVAPSAPPAPATGALAEPPAADPSALARVAQALVHAEALGAGATRLALDFAAVAPATDDALVQELVEPLREQVVELALARSRVTDATLALCAGLPRLERLDLRATRVTGAGLARLAGHPSLAVLVLAQTEVGDAAVDALLALPALRTVHLWNAGLSEPALARLHAERPELEVEAGDAPEGEALEQEPELVFSSDRPLAEAERAEQAGPAPGPINAACPVTGRPVDPSHTLLYEGRTIGFCCPDCPARFLADPAQYASRLP